MTTILQFNDELNNRGLWDRDNGILPDADNSPDNRDADPNPFSKYIQGAFVNQNYTLDNTDNDLTALTEIANRTDPARILDASNMSPEGVDADIFELMLHQDKQDPASNYMGLDASDFVGQQQTANFRYQKFSKLLSQVPKAKPMFIDEGNKVAQPNFRERLRSLPLDFLSGVRMDDLKDTESMVNKANEIATKLATKKLDSIINQTIPKGVVPFVKDYVKHLVQHTEL